MGLDMYLNKVRRIGDAGLLQILKVNDYFSYLERPERWKDCSMKDWCNIDESEVDMNLVDAYKDEYRTVYSVNDKDKRYAWNSCTKMIAYWRKANQIHNWFVKNVQNGEDDCLPYEVTKTQLKTLLYICKVVKGSIELVDGEVINGYDNNGPIIQRGKIIADPTIAKALLPTSEGFFFGSYNYDEYYAGQIDDTIEQLEAILEDTDFDADIVYYQASW